MALFDRPCHTVSEILDLLLVTGTPACRAACRYVVYPVVQNVFLRTDVKVRTLSSRPSLEDDTVAAIIIPKPDIDGRDQQDDNYCPRRWTNRSARYIYVFYSHVATSRAVQQKRRQPVEYTGESCVLALSTECVPRESSFDPSKSAPQRRRRRDTSD